MSYNLENGNGHPPLEMAGGGDDFASLAREHRTKHNQIVLKKVRYARMATLQSIHEYDIAGDIRQSDEFAAIRKYDSLWHVIAELLSGAGLSEIGIHKIEVLLLKLPRAIKKYYDVLILNDKALGALMAELASEKYNDVRKVINDIFIRDTRTAQKKPKKPPEYILRGITQSRKNRTAATEF